MIIRTMAMASAITMPIVITISQAAEPCVERMSAWSSATSSKIPVVGPEKFAKV